MKPRITSPLALAVSLFIALVTLPPVAHAQSKVQRTITDTGIVTLGANQILRITVASADVNGDGFVGKGGSTARFGKAMYMQLGCNGQGVCKYSLDSQSLSAPVTLDPGEVATFDVSGGVNPVRAAVLSNDANLRVNALIVDITTGNTVSLVALAGHTFLP